MIVADAPGQSSYALPIELIKGAFEHWNHPWQLIAMSSGAAQATSAGRTLQYPIALPAGGEVTVGTAVYKILSAQLDRDDKGTLFMRLSVRITNNSDEVPHYNHPWSNLRLLVDGVPRAPVSATDYNIPMDSAIDADVAFVIPNTAKSLELKVRLQEKTAKIPIDLKPAKP